MKTTKRTYVRYDVGHPNGRVVSFTVCGHDGCQRAAESGFHFCLKHWTDAKEA